MTNDKESVRTMIGLLCKKIEILKDIYLLSEKQKNSIKEENIKALNRIIKLKQMQIKEVDKLDQKFQQNFNKVKEKYNVNSFEEIVGLNKEECRELKLKVVEIKEIISKINDLEKDNNQKAKELLSKFGNEIKKIRNIKKTNKAYNYGSTFKPQSYFIDKKK